MANEISEFPQNNNTSIHIPSPNYQSMAHIRNGQKCKVAFIRAGFRATQRLSGLGITPGTIIKIDGRGPFRGPVRISLRGTQLAIGLGLAHKIFVEPL